MRDIGFIDAITFIGTVNPLSGDLGVFVPLEHAMLAWEVRSSERTKVFAQYNLVGALAGAAGSLAAASPDFIMRTEIELWCSRSAQSHAVSTTTLMYR